MTQLLKPPSASIPIATVVKTLRQELARASSGKDVLDVAARAAKAARVYAAIGRSVADCNPLSEVYLSACWTFGDLVKGLPQGNSAQRHIDVPLGTRRQRQYARGLRRAIAESKIPEYVRWATERLEAASIAGCLTWVEGAARTAREEDNRRRLSRQMALASQALGIHHGDFRILSPEILPAESVQLVFTDPPYDEDGIELFKAAAQEASRVLVPGGSFLAYSGQKYLAQAMMACASHLTYWWSFALSHEGPGQLLQKLGVRCHWKPILWFVKQTRGDVTDIVHDVVRGGGREKGAHPWQQAEAEAGGLIELFTRPGDLVVDFMAGSGTVLVAAKKLDRRFTGFEIRADHIETIVQHVA